MGGRKPAEIRFISLIYSLKWLYRNRSEWLPWQATYGHGSINRPLGFASPPAAPIHRNTVGERCESCTI